MRLTSIYNAQFHYLATGDT